MKSSASCAPAGFIRTKSDRRLFKKGWFTKYQNQHYKVCLFHINLKIISPSIYSPAKQQLNTQNSGFHAFYNFSQKLTFWLTRGKIVICHYRVAIIIIHFLWPSEFLSECKSRRKYVQVSLTTHKSPLPAITREISLSLRCSFQQSDLLLQ